MKLPKGFKANGIKSGIKQSGNKDLGLIFSQTDCLSTGVFTQNSVKAACVTDNIESLSARESFRAIIVNAGNANACTGEEGLMAVKKVKKLLASKASINEGEVLTASTGVIGVQLPVNKIEASMDSLIEGLNENGQDFAEAIMTTDTKPKYAYLEVGNALISGFTKGSGMIHPNMATMLSFILTDLDVSELDIQRALRDAVSLTFNQISVDGDTSTNDMVLLMANSLSGTKLSQLEFTQRLSEVCLELAKQIVIDGEGATKLFEVRVKGGDSFEDCLKMAKGIASSSLVKSAVFGNDPNWGRILASAGQFGRVNLNEASLELMGVEVLKNGRTVAFDKTELSETIKNSKELIFELKVGSTDFEGRAWGCDLTYDYVKINAEYTT
jgi:glutamate N-acetyltransferase/amino-acid N-acetyltransferase